MCSFDAECKEVLDCLGKCDPTDSECGFACGLGTEAGQNPHFISLMQCLVENDCMDKYDELGACLAADDQALDITDYDQVRPLEKQIQQSVGFVQDQEPYPH